mmetsp:Transcript_43206/g.101608  ORF Transcript_43206/g.101608 Transcript_43206/m.101608 type:complete len:279 (-) Transcript_43206:49-885(-)
MNLLYHCTIFRTNIQHHVCGHTNQKIAHGVHEDSAYKTSIGDEGVGAVATLGQVSQQFTINAVAKAHGTDSPWKAFVLRFVATDIWQDFITSHGLTICEKNHMSNSRFSLVHLCLPQNFHAFTEATPNISATSVIQCLQLLVGMSLASLIHFGKWDLSHLLIIKCNNRTSIRGPKSCNDGSNSVLCNVQKGQPIAFHNAGSRLNGRQGSHGTGDINNANNVRRRAGIYAASWLVWHINSEEDLVQMLLGTGALLTDHFHLWCSHCAVEKHKLASHSAV